MNPDTLSEALTSQALAPTLGALAVLVAMLARRANGDPLLDQLKAAAKAARKPALAGLLAAGTALMAGASYVAAVSAGLGVLFSASNLLREPAK